MKIAALPDNEKARLASLERYGLLDTPPEAVFDCITQAAADVCETPIALISLLDPNRQWFKACIGLEVRETSRDIAFCTHAIESPSQLLEVEDATLDDRFFDNPLVLGKPGIRFYAGRPLVTPDGYALGTLCVIDRVPRKLTESQRNAMVNLSDAIVAMLEERRQSRVSAIGRAIEETIQCGIMVTDANAADNPIMHCNHGFEMLTGYKKAEVIGRNCRFLQGEDTDPNSIAKLRDAIASQRECTVVLKNYCRDGTGFWNELTITPVWDSNGALTHFVGIQTDITMRRQAEEAVQESHRMLEQRVLRRTAELAESEERYRELFENAGDLIQSVGPDGAFVYVNPAWIETLGYSEDEVGSLKMFDIIHPDDLAHCQSIFKRVMAGEIVDKVQTKFLTKSGDAVLVEGSASCQFKDGSPIATRAIFHDVTARNAAAESLRIAKELAEDATATKTQFLAAANHDMRQPLHAIKLYLATLTHQLSKPKNLLLCQKISNTVNATSELLDTLLDQSRLESGAITPTMSDFRMGDLFEGLAVENEPFAKERGLELGFGDCPVVIRSDQPLLRRVLHNLIGNAIRYTDSGRVDIQCLCEGDQARIEVRDSGIGIPEQELESIFEDYVQLENTGKNRGNGLGLGLSIVKHISRLLNHRLDVNSEVGVGSTFSVEVPIVRWLDRESPSIAEVPSVKPKPAHRSGPGPLVLLVDDDRAIVEATNSLLCELKCRVCIAQNSNEALAHVRNGVRPDLIITDYRLPRINGVELIQRIRRETETETPAILMTGDNSALEIVENKLTRFTILYKPIDVDRLVSIIDIVDVNRASR